MDDRLVEGPPNPKRQKLDPFSGPSDSSAFNNYGLGSTDSTQGGGVFSPRNQWNIGQSQNVLANILEQDLPDELISNSSWLPDHIGNQKPPAQGPGPGAMQNGMDGADPNTIRQMQLNHIAQGNNGMVNNSLLTGGQLGNKNSNMQSPPNVSVAKGGVDQLNIGGLPSSIANVTGMQAVSNNGSSPQIMSSIQGLNNAGGNMIMTNSNMNSIGSMGGGGLVVSSGAVNKPLLTSAQNMIGAQSHHPGGHNVPQYLRQGLQNGPMLNRMNHIQQQRQPGPHGLHIGGARLQNSNLIIGGAINQGMPGNSPYSYPNSNIGQGGPPGVVTPQQKIPGAGPRFGAPSAGPVGNVGPLGGDGSMVQTQPPAPSPAQPQSGAPSVSQPGPQQATQNQGGQPGAPPAPSTDPEKRKLIQQQLVLLLHAHKCQRRESTQANGEAWTCTLPHCKTMKNVLNHMTTCNAGRSCSVAHCSSSRQIISHWKNCIRQDCPVCLPLKQADKNRSNNAAATANTPQNASQPPAVNASDAQMRRTYDTLGLPAPTHPQGGLLPNAVAPRPAIRLPMNPNQPMQNRGPAGILRPCPPGPQGVAPNVSIAPNVSLPIGSDPNSNVLGQTQNINQQQANAFQQSLTNAANMLASGAEAVNQGLISQLPGGLQPGQVTASPVTGTKEWHQSVTADLRNHLVHKLVQAIFPTPDPQALLDRRMHNLVAYARKVEGDMYEMANSRSEYYHLLAEKIYKIQKELEEKRQKRKEQQLQAQQGNRPNIQGVVRPTAMVPPQQPLRSGSPNSLPASLALGNLPGNQMVFSVQQPNSVQSGQSLPQQGQQQSNVVGLPGPSPTASNPGLSPFGNPLSQGSNTSSSNQFISNGPTITLPQVSPAGNQVNQFDMLKNNRVPPSPSSFNQQPTPQPVSQANTNGLQQNGTSRLPNSENVPTPHATPNASGPKSVSSSRGPSPSPATPVQASPGNLGKGMSTAERASLNAPRQSSLSSQMAALMAASENNEDSPPASEGNKGKLDQIKTEPMEMKSEMEDNSQNDSQGEQSGGGKHMNNDMKSDIKSEIKMEPMEGEVTVKEENSGLNDHGTDGSADVKPSPDSLQVASSSGEATGKRTKVFKPDELRQKLMPTLEKLYRQDPESIPFRQPVDPQSLGIPDYFDIVKRPMDLSTIKRKLDLGTYMDPWEYVDDVWLMFDNAWLYNRKTSRVYRYCTKLSEVFEQEIDPVMQSMGYCCGRKYTFNPQVLCCYGKQLCTIPRDAKYYSYQNSLKAYGLGSDRYTFCQKCFNDIQGDTVTLGDDPTQAQTAIKKDQFKEMKNDHLEMEDFVHCTDCGRKLHRICVLHHEVIWPQGFTCDECLKMKNQKRRDNKFNAKKLPVTNLGIYIENRVNIFLKKKEAGAGEVHIRVVSSSEKTVEVKPGMRSKFVETGDLSAEFPYRAKALFAFEEIDGVDVCFFGMHVQEYGSECPSPNTRRVYIAYLDSVHFFKPKQFRTAVYHEILLGYLDYVKQLGYTMAHIWACPPSEGDDYIFHCHPPDQKIPKPKRLQDWYKKMLDKGIIERIIVDYKDILKQAMEDNLRSAADLPYFEGDFWPNVLEESIKELDQEEEEKRRQAEAAEAAIFSSMEESEVGPDGKKKGQKKAKKSTKSKANQRKSNNKKSNTPQTGNDLSAKIFATMDKHKDVFFVIRLHSVQSAASLKPIQDPDPFISCDLMDGRDAFLTLAREKHYEFSSLRRAKYSTMSMLYELHNQGQDKFVYTCNECKAHVETRYHCTVCDDFDLCIQCYGKVGHQHKMEKLGLLDDASSPTDNNKTNPQEARKLSIQRCIQSLVHACQCRDANCRLASCKKMSRVVNHTRSCKRKTNGGCPICKQLIALCCYHAKNCPENKCPVPFCPNIKYKLKQQQLQQRLQQAQLLRRRMAVMSRTAPTGNVMQGGNTSGVSGVGQVVPGAVSPVGGMNSGLPNAQMNMQSSHQPGIGMKPGTQTPPANVLQVVKQVQEEAARQQAPHVGYGKGVPGPVLNSLNMPPPPSIRGMPSHIGANQGGNLLPMDQWQQRYPGAVGPGIRQAGGQGMNPGPGAMAGGTPNVQAAAQAAASQVRPGQPNVQGPPMGNPAAAANVLQKQALQQLMQTLRSPQSPEQQQQILSILKANPQLMAAFIKQRQQVQQVQAQQMQAGGSNPPQQLQHILAQPNAPAQQQQQQQQQQHASRMAMAQAGMLNQGQPGLGQVPVGGPGQPLTQQQQWYKHQQLLAMQRQQQQAAAQQQQQQQQQQQANFPQPGSYQQRLPGIRQPHMGYNNAFNDQQYPQMQGLKPTPPPVPSPQGMMGPPQGQGISSVQQQLMQSVRSPPPIRSPQPSPSSRPSPSPRNQAVSSPRGPQPSPHDLASSELLLGQNHSSLHPHASPAGAPNQDNDLPAMTPQDQLSKFVEQL